MMDDSALQVKDKKQVEGRAELTRSGPVFIPPVDIYENREALVLVADMPGADSQSVEIHLKDNELSIRGRVDAKEEGGTPAYTEYESGDYLRSFTLSSVIDQEKIEANMKDGVLKIILPKAGAAQPRQIDVTAG